VLKCRFHFLQQITRVTLEDGKAQKAEVRSPLWHPVGRQIDRQTDRPGDSQTSESIAVYVPNEPKPI